MFSRRNFLFGASVGIASLPACDFKLSDSRPNILLIIADDLGKEGLGPYSQAIYKTPALDRLAAKGRTFTRFYVNPSCSPSRAAMYTGLYPARSGWKSNLEQQPDDNKNIPGPTFASILKEAGYKTAIAGKWHVGQLWTNSLHTRLRGFKYSCMSLDTQTTGLWGMRLLVRGGKGKPKRSQLPKNKYGPDEQVSWLLDFMKRPGPWLAVMAHDLPHLPFEATPLAGKQDWPAGDPRWYADMVAYMDRLTEKLVDAAPRNTLVVFCTDNGGNFDGKGTLLESGINVPLIARWPGVIPAGTRAHGLCDATDLLPTFAELAGVRAKSDGTSMVPQFKGKGGKSHAFAHWSPPYSGYEAWAVIGKTHKLVGDKLFDLTTDSAQRKPLNGRESIRRELQAIGEKLSAPA